MIADLPDELVALSRALADGAGLDRVVASRRARGSRPAAVLALFGAGDDGLDLTFVERAHTLRSHPGQMAFPGGALDESDADAAAAALREAGEEVGLDGASAVVIGTLPAAHVSVSGFDVTTVAAWWRTPHPIGVRDPAEVASVHRLALDRLADPAHRWTAMHPQGYRGPAFVIEDVFIWGLTAHLLDGLLDLGGWQQPWDRERSQPVPERYLLDAQARASRRTDPDAH